MFDFLSIRKSVEALGRECTEQRAALEQLKQKREEVAAAPPSRDDVIRVICQRINAVSQSYPQDLQRVIGPILAGGKVENVKNWQLNFLLPAAYSDGANTSASSLMSGLAFLLGDDLMNEAVGRAIRRMEWPDNAIPLAQREKELARLDGEIGKLEKQLADLSIEAAKAGISIG